MSSKTMMEKKTPLPLLVFHSNFFKFLLMKFLFAVEISRRNKKLLRIILKDKNMQIFLCNNYTKLSPNSQDNNKIIIHQHAEKLVSSLH